MEEGTSMSSVTIDRCCFRLNFIFVGSLFRQGIIPPAGPATDVGVWRASYHIFSRLDTGVSRIDHTSDHRNCITSYLWCLFSPVRHTSKHVWVSRDGCCFPHSFQDLVNLNNWDGRNDHLAILGVDIHCLKGWLGRLSTISLLSVFHIPQPYRKSITALFSLAFSSPPSLGKRYST